MTILQLSLRGGGMILLLLALRPLLFRRVSKRLLPLLWLATLPLLLFPFSLGFLPFPLPQELARFEVADWLWLLYLGVAGLLLGYLLLGYLAGLRAFREGAPTNHPVIMAWTREHTLSAEVKLSDRVRSPLSGGLFRPTILLPPTLDLEDRERVNCVLAHELVHLRRRDGLWKLLLLMTLAFHWFNPLVWVMTVLFQRDLEYACDEAVLAGDFGVTRPAYARALFWAATLPSPTRPPLPFTGFRSSVTARRIAAVADYRLHSPTHKPAALFATALLVLCLLSLAPTRPQNPSPALLSTMQSQRITVTANSCGWSKEADDHLGGVIARMRREQRLIGRTTFTEADGTLITFKIWLDLPERIHISALSQTFPPEPQKGGASA